MKNSQHKNKLAGIGFLFAVVFCMMITGVSVSAAVYKESNYSRVYNYSYYVANNKDLSSSIRKSRTKALTHFVEHGMAQGRQAIKSFNVKIYKKNYPDLAKLYGTNYKKYYEHWQKVGYKKRFAKHALSYYTFALTISPNGGTYNGSKGYTIEKHHHGRTITLKTPTRSGYDFAGWRLSVGMGTISGNKFKYTMDKKGTNKIIALWTKKTAGRYSGAYKIADVALTQLGKGGETYWDYFSDVFSSPQEWCCMFTTWCAYKAGFISKTAAYGSFGSGRFPRTASQRELARAFAARGQLKLRSSGYKPQKGDIVFFSYSSNQSDYESYRHVGILVSYSENKIVTVEGNTGTYNKYTSYVKKCTYQPGDSKFSQIVSYGVIK